MKCEPTFKDFVDQRLEENGVTIEGIAIKDDKTLFAGFRGPVLEGDEGKSRAVVLSAPLDAVVRRWRRATQIVPPAARPGPRGARSRRL